MDRLNRVRSLDEISEVLLGPLVDRTLELMIEHGLIPIDGCTASSVDKARRNLNGRCTKEDCTITH